MNIIRFGGMDFDLDPILTLDKNEFKRFVDGFNLTKLDKTTIKPDLQCFQDSPDRQVRTIIYWHLPEEPDRPFIGLVETAVIQETRIGGIVDCTIMMPSEEAVENFVWEFPPDEYRKDPKAYTILKIDSAEEFQQLINFSRRLKNMASNGYPTNTEVKVQMIVDTILLYSSGDGEFSAAEDAEKIKTLIDISCPLRGEREAAYILAGKRLREKREELEKGETNESNSD